MLKFENLGETLLTQNLAKIILVSGALLSSAASFGKEFVAFGDLRGHFEPCGCNPETDMGGVARISSFIDLERSRFKELEVFSLGNNFHHDDFTLEDEFIQKGVEDLEATAMLVGKTEWIHRNRLKSKKRYLLSNSESDEFKKFIETKSSLIFGLTEYDSLKIKKKTLDKIYQKLEKSKKRTVLLYSGTKKTFFNLKLADKFDHVLVANFRPFSDAPDARERLDESLLSIGPNSFVSPLGGQGMITHMIPTVDLKPENQGKSFSPGSGIFGDAGPSFKNFHWLLREGLYGKKPEGLLNAYKKASSNSFKFRVSQRVKDIEGSDYVGSEACKACHSDAYEVYKKSSHHTAYETLIKANQHENEVCVKCHVVGYDKKGGFVSIEHTPHLAGVGCEQCHGPRKAHVRNPTKKQNYNVSLPSESCSACHVPPHSVNFDYTKYWQKILHGPIR